VTIRIRTGFLVSVFARMFLLETCLRVFAQFYAATDRELL
jgi:hypothetical protein